MEQLIIDYKMQSEGVKGQLKYKHSKSSINKFIEKFHRRFSETVKNDKLTLVIKNKADARLKHDLLLKLNKSLISIDIDHGHHHLRFDLHDHHFFVDNKRRPLKEMSHMAKILKKIKAYVDSEKMDISTQ